MLSKIQTMTTLQAGDKAPHFQGTTQHGQPISSEDYTGKKYILFFYPKANTPGCTAEACNFQDNMDRWAQEGYAIIGVSADSVQRQKNFAEKHQLQYPLIADEDKTVIKAFGAWGLKKNYGREYEGIFRLTFVVDAEGLIETIIKRVKTKEASEQLYKSLDLEA